MDYLVSENHILNDDIYHFQVRLRESIERLKIRIPIFRLQAAVLGSASKIVTGACFLFVMNSRIRYNCTFNVLGHPYSVI